MYKIIDVGSWDKIAETPVSLVPMTDRFTLNDQKSYLKKQASSLEFMNKIADYEVKPGDIPIHVIAVGETEKYGCNRNGDGFNRETCKSQHPTFVKNGRYYRHHQSKDKSKSFGKIAQSYYNPEMGRIELLVIGNGTKEAAERNGGLVMPEATLNKIAEGKSLAWSMGCSLPYDVCAICGHKSASPREYCTEDTCIHPITKEHFPGCKKGLTKLAADGTQQYVENPNCNYYDISEVGIPADRTAYGWKADYLTKAASADYVIGGAELAELRGFDMDMRAADHSRGELRQMLYKLAALEDLCNTDDAKSSLFKLASILSPQSAAMADELRSLSETKKIAALKYLASRNVILSPESFLRMQNVKIAEATPFVLRKYLINMYNKLIKVDNLSKFSAYTFNGYDTATKPLFSLRMEKTAEAEAINETNVQLKIGCACMRKSELQVLDLNSDTDLSSLAVSYALYKAAALLEIPAGNRDLAAMVAISENQLI